MVFRACLGAAEGKAPDDILVPAPPFCTEPLLIGMEPLPLFVVSFESLRIGMDKEHFQETHIILNPILRGFHPDPSILRVDDDFYIATSTFQWFPGVRI